MANPCPCCSGAEYTQCCEAIVVGSKIASTPLELMRSRYTAHVVKNMPHIIRTMRGKPLKLFDEEKTRTEWFEQCTWDRLEIIEASEVTASDHEGIVEFKAHYTFEGAQHVMHERSKFQKDQGQWFYVARQNNLAGVENSAKIGRNDPCSCGSGKKFKKCCAV